MERRIIRHDVVARLTVFLGIAFMAFCVAAPHAQALTYTYADALRTPEGQARSSGFRSAVTGGTAQVQLGVGTSVIISHYNSPGYREVGYAAGNAPYTTTLSHTRYTNLYSKCYWAFQNVGGEADLTCTVKG